MDIVYVLSNPAMPGLVKIGMTASGEASGRLAQLYSTGVPFPFKLEFACRVEDGEKVERALHTAFGPNRVNPKREFFSIDPNQAIAILNLLNVEDATSEVERLPTTIQSQEIEAGNEYAARRPNLNFVEMGIPVGSTLQFTKSDATVTVVGERKVQLENEELSLTAATRQLLGLDYSVAPGPFWTFQGRSLRDIYEETYPDR